MLQRSREMNEENILPIVSLCVIADRNKAPPGFTPVSIRVRRGINFIAENFCKTFYSKNHVSGGIFMQKTDFFVIKNRKPHSETANVDF